MVAMVTDRCRPFSKWSYFINYHIKVTMLYNSLADFEKCQIGRYVRHKIATKMQYCGTRNRDRVHELVLKLIIIGWY